MEEVTPRVHGLLKAIQLSIERVLHENVQQNPIIGSSQALLDFLRARLRHRQREELVVIYMDRQNRLIKSDCVQGSVSRVHLCPRDVATRALELFATAVIIGHNHPGGDAKPSKEDVVTTRQVHLALLASVCGHWAHLGEIFGFLARYPFEIPAFFVAVEPADAKFS